MFEQTNQTNTSEEGFCAEVFEAELGITADEQSEPTPSTQAPQAMQASAQTTQVPAEPTYAVKYNGKEVNLTLDELKTRAQMGMNYDHVKSENDRMKNSQLYKRLQTMAQREGISMEACASRLLERENATRLSDLRSRGMDASAAKQFLDMEAQLAYAEEKRAQDAPYVAFARKFPEMKYDDISPEVWARFAQTRDLIGAYTEAENERLRAQISAMQQNEKNAQAHIGSLANLGAAAQMDPFLEGLLE